MSHIHRALILVALVLPAQALADGATVTLPAEAAPAPPIEAPAVTDAETVPDVKGYDPLPTGLVPDHIEPFGAPLPSEILAPERERRHGMPAS